MSSARRKNQRARTVAPASTSKAPARLRVRSVLILADADKLKVQALVPRLHARLAERGVAVQVEADLRAFYKRRSAGRPKKGDLQPDLVLVLGGDGAILAAARALAETPVPTLGINFGRVGYLASVEAGEWAEALDEVFEGQAVLEHRMRLAVELHARDEIRVVALNDAVITRGAFQGMLSIALKVGPDWVTNYRADGLVVATPSGSTAYSMAAGGPILAAEMEAFAVTPVSPQSLSHRPLVVGCEHPLELRVTRASGLTTLVVDGQGFYPMDEGDHVRIARHAVAWPLLSRPAFDSYTRLRDRLGWRGSVEPDVFPLDDVPRTREIDAGTGGVL